MHWACVNFPCSLALTYFFCFAATRTRIALDCKAKERPKDEKKTAADGGSIGGCIVAGCFGPFVRLLEFENNIGGLGGCFFVFFASRVVCVVSCLVAQIGIVEFLSFSLTGVSNEIRSILQQFPTTQLNSGRGVASPHCWW